MVRVRGTNSFRLGGRCCEGEGDDAKGFDSLDRDWLLAVVGLANEDEGPIIA